MPENLPRLCFLGENQPLLESSAQRLFADAQAQAGNSSPLDLSSTLLLVPTAQAGRRLREQLAVLAGERGLLSPVVMTPPALWQAGLPTEVASDLESLFAWREVLESSQARQLLGLPELELSANSGQGSLQDGQIRQLDGQIRQLAQQLESLRFELAQGRQTTGEVLDFSRLSARLNALGEEDLRWTELAELEAQFRAQLQAWQRLDPVLARPRWPENFASIKRLILLGLPDPMPRLLPWLEQLLEQGLELESWLAASEALRPKLDGWGRPLELAWAEAEIDLGAAALHSFASAEELSSAAVEQVASWGVASDQLSAGIADTALSQSLQAKFEAAGWACFDPQAQQAAVSGILPVLELLREFLGGRIQGLWELASQPGLERLFPALAEVSAEKLAWLAQRWAEVLPTSEQGLQHLVSQLERALEFGKSKDAQEGKDGQTASEVAGAQEAAESAQAQFAREQRVRAEWVTWLRELVEEMLSWRRDFLRQGDAASALHQLAEALGGLDDNAGGAWWRHWDLRLQQLEALQTQGVQLEAREALSWLLQSMPSVAALREGEGAEIALEFEGWLELGFSAKPSLLLCGLHEQVVPAKPVDGAFLHDGLREKLGLRGRAWRFAVDALRLQQLLAARDSERVFIGCVAQLPGGETRLPSRLLLRPSKQEKGALAQRALALFGQEGASSPAILPAWDRGELRLELKAAQAKANSLPWRRGLSASKLGDYLSCPLRFALKHIWGMERLEWEEHEMNSRASGNLVHEVVEDFAREKALCNSEQAAEIERFLLHRLEVHAQVRFGTKPPLPLRLQLRSLQQRLAGFARWQAAWRSQGWRIREAEYHLGGADGSWQLGGVLFEGFVDRIDQHEDGRWMIWDYKTRATAGGKAKTGSPLSHPDMVAELGDGIHWKNAPQTEPSLAPLLEIPGKSRSSWKRWVNLQLPLYALEWQRHQQSSQVSVGQIVLGAVEAEVGGYQWSAWSGAQAEALWQSAHQWAEAAVARIASGVFWPPSTQPPSWDEFGKLAPDGWAQAFSRQSLELLGWPETEVGKVSSREVEAGQLEQGSEQR